MISEGRRYVVAFPQVWASPSEPPLPQPMMLLLTSRYFTRVRITTAATNTDVPRIDQVHSIVPGVVLMVSVSTAYMNVDSESRRGYGISITGDTPFSVATQQAWQGNGETAQHLPTDSWGTSYYSMNFYQDRFGTEARYEHRPAQILVIAGSDSSVVTYRPTAETEGGIDAQSVLKGASQTVTLMRGETFLIKSKIDPLKFRDSSTDLSATYITSTKPIGVISGHTKGAIARMPDFLPPSGPFVLDLHFVRNNVHDVMYPTTLAGTAFVTVPLLYNQSRIVGQSSPTNGIEDDRGDVIRFIALENNTLVQKRRVDGPGNTNVFTLQKGESRIVPSQESAAYWITSAPVLVGQYGKSYAKFWAEEIKAGGLVNDQTQAFPNIEAGMPMLQMVPSTNRWITHATFSSPEGMDAFLNVVFKMSESSSILIDGKPLQTAYGRAIRTLNGTEYAYVRTQQAAGNHTIESLSDSVRWMAWNYASLDGLQLGRAYGTAVGIDLTTPCSGDSLYDSAEAEGCDYTKVTSWVTSSGCGSIRMIHALDLNNARLIIDEGFRDGDTLGVYRVKILDPKKTATATVRTVSSSGDYIDRVVHFFPDTVLASKSKHDFGRQPSLVTVTDTLTITHSLADSSVVITQVSMAHNQPEFLVSGVSLPFLLSPGKSMKVLVSCRLLSEVSVIDTLVVRTNCADWKLTEYRVRSIGDTTTSVSGETETPGLSFSVTPQPITGEAVLLLSTIERGACSIEYVDAAGRVVASQSEHVDSSPQPISLTPTALPSGAYTIRVKCNERQASTRIIVTR